MHIRLVTGYSLLFSVGAFANTPTCDVNLLQQRIELSLAQGSRAEHNAYDVTDATFDASGGYGTRKSDSTGGLAGRTSGPAAPADPPGASADQRISNATNATPSDSTGGPAGRTSGPAAPADPPVEPADQRTSNATNATSSDSMGGPAVRTSGPAAPADPLVEPANQRTSNATNAMSSDVDMTVKLPAKEEHVFDEMEKEFDDSEHSLASAKDLAVEFKKQTALEIEYREKAAQAEANKLKALKKMNVLVNESIHLERATLSHGIPKSASSWLPATSATRAEKSLSHAAEDAAEAASLTEVVRWAEGNYTFAIKAALEATRKREKISARMQSLLDSSIMNELDLSRHIKVTLSNSEGELQKNQSGVNLTDIVQAYIDEQYPAASANKTVVVKVIVKNEATVSCGNHSAATCADCPQGHGAAWCKGDCSWTKYYCHEAHAHKASDSDADSDDSDDHDEPNVVPSAVYIIGLAFLLGVALAGIAIMQGR